MEYRIAVPQDFVRSIKSPHTDDLTVIHAFVKIKDFQSGKIPDDVNPRAHDEIKLNGRIAQAISDSLDENPEVFHLANRGCLVIAKEAWYDNQTKTLHFTVESPEDHGMVDGATTDRILAKLKSQVSNAEFNTLRESEIPNKFKDSYLHLEIIAGDISSELRLLLARARNTSEQVKEFSLEDLGHGFDWIKDIVEKSELRGRIRYKENDPKPVDIRTVLALLSMFHPKWFREQTNPRESKDPIKAYTGKGAVLDEYKDETYKAEFEKVAPVVVDILKLYDYVHANFQEQYQKVYERGQLGRRVEVKFREKTLPLTETVTKYILPDGWLYPLLASFRVLLDWPKNGRGDVRWTIDPFKFFDENGGLLVADIIEQAEELGRNPNQLGKSKRLWSGLRIAVKERLSEIKSSAV